MQYAVTSLREIMFKSVTGRVKSTVLFTDTSYFISILETNKQVISKCWVFKVFFVPSPSPSPRSVRSESDCPTVIAKYLPSHWHWTSTTNNMDAVCQTYPNIIWYIFMFWFTAFGKISRQITVIPLTLLTTTKPLMYDSCSTSTQQAQQAWYGVSQLQQDAFSSATTKDQLWFHIYVTHFSTSASFMNWPRYIIESKSRSHFGCQVP